MILSTEWRKSLVGVRLLHRISAAGTLLLGTLALQLGAQTFPGKPITIVLPYAPGGTIDIQGRLLGNGLWNVGDKTLIDGLLVNGSAKLVGWFSTVTKVFQTGYIYHYAFVMILGILGFLVYFLPFWHA